MIKMILDNLTEEQRAQLMYAFEQQISQYIELSDNRFIGVNVNTLKTLKIRESNGVWAYGEILNG